MNEEIVDGIVVGDLSYHAGLFANGKELKTKSTSDYSEAINWANEEIKKLKESIGEEELKRLGWNQFELRYF